MSQLDTFQSFVKPVKNPVLSAYCTELTSIKQDDVDNAPFFAEAMSQFEQWINHSDGDITYLLTWGYYDINQLMTEYEVKHYQGKLLDILEYSS